MEIYDAFPLKKTAQAAADDIRYTRMYRYVEVRPYKHPYYKWAIWVGNR